MHMYHGMHPYPNYNNGSILKRRRIKKCTNPSGTLYIFSAEAHELWFNWGSNRQTRELLSPLENHESSISRLMMLVPFFPPTHACVGSLNQVSHLPPQFPQAHSQPYLYNSYLRLFLPNPLSDCTFRDIISNFINRHNHVVMILVLLSPRSLIGWPPQYDPTFHPHSYSYISALSSTVTKHLSPTARRLPSSQISAQSCKSFCSIIVYFSARSDCQHH